MRLANRAHVLVPVVLLVTLAVPRLHAGSTARQTEWQLPNENSRLSFAADTPIVFIDQGRNVAEWDKLAAFWNESTESVLARVRKYENATSSPVRSSSAAPRTVARSMS